MDSRDCLLPDNGLVGLYFDAGNFWNYLSVGVVSFAPSIVRITEVIIS